MSSRIRTLSGIVALLLVASATAARAQDTKIGLIDTRRLITQSAAGKEVLARLDKLAEEKAGRIKPVNDEIQQLQKRIADGRVSLSDDKIAQLQRELDEKVTSARRLREDLQKEMEEAQATAFAELERKLGPLVEQFGREQGYSFILNVGFFTQANQPSGIVWADEKVDITDELIQRIDAGGAPAAP
ncbi:MAG TPA: OmpH family outer membrane protein [Thermoanaerobaculia bacterium]|nr:OmpH family outer membrane protein [Thermoanaerobaculia bacterium]